jgi:signal transduction histidine kinase/ActR/RegA family two-component response regulator
MRRNHDGAFPKYGAALAACAALLTLKAAALEASEAPVRLSVWICALLLCVAVSAFVYHNQRRKANAQEKILKEQLDSALTAQGELLENRAFMKLALQRAGMNFWEYDPERHTVCFTDSVVPHGEVPAKIENFPTSVSHNFHPEDFPTVQEAFRKIDAGGDAAAYTCRFKETGDTYRWLECHLSSAYGKDGHRRKILCTSFDITDQKITEQEYERQLAQFKAAIPNPVVFFRINLTKRQYQGGESDYKALLQTNDHSLQTLLEAVYSRSVTTEEEQAIRSSFNIRTMEELAARGETNATFERRCWYNGKIHWVEVRLYITRNPITGDSEVLLYSLNIDEKKNIEQIVSAAVGSGYIHLFQLDLVEKKVRRFDERRQVLKPPYEVDAEKEIERGLCSHYLGDDLESFIQNNSLAAIGRNLASCERYVQYGTFQMSDGKPQRIKISYFWQDRVQKLVCVTTNDVTAAFEEERRRNQELKEALMTAEQASRTKTDFLSRMSHEIRTPMNAIMGLTQLGLEDQLDGKAKSYLYRINESSEYLLGLINDVLDMSRIESGKFLLTVENTDTSDFFHSVETIIGPQMKEKNIRFTLDSSGVKTDYVIIDKRRMQQIYINLLSNAMKYSESGTEIVCKVFHEIIDDSVRSTIVIRDQGCGMSEAFQQKMFQPFEQEHNPHSSAQVGTGLGLTIVKNIIDQMGGTISVKSALGEGTEFTIVLLAPIGHKPETVDAPVQTQEKSLRGKRVLLVEDHPINTEIASRLLTREGVNVEHAENGEISVEMFLSHTPGYYDAILMDIRMPVMDGLTAAKTIRGLLDRPDAATVPIIAMTANAFDTDREMSYQAGMNAHLAKPIKPKELYDTLRQYTAD